MAQISGYLETRKYNHKIYDRLLKKLTKIEKDNKQFVPGLDIEIGMSAKYQTPYVKIACDDLNKTGRVTEDVEDAIDKVGYSVTDTEERSYGIYIGFSD